MWRHWDEDSRGLDTGNHDALLDAADFVAAFKRDRAYIFPVLRRLPINEVL